MTYGAVVKGTFRARPNRFIAQVDTEEGTQICHVKNTGRCMELLVPGATVYLAEGQKPRPQDQVRPGGPWRRAACSSTWTARRPTRWPRSTCPSCCRASPPGGGSRCGGDSRFDLYAEAAGERWFVEVKGVTLEENRRGPSIPTPPPSGG